MTSCKHVREMNNPLFLYNKTGVYRVFIFLIFALKHRLWVLVTSKNIIFSTFRNCFKLQGHVFVMRLIDEFENWLDSETIGFLLTKPLSS